VREVSQAVVEYRQEMKTKRALETIAFLKGLKPGTVLYQSWGYDQTNVDFYEVVEVRNSTVWLQEIGCKTVEGSEGRDCDYVMPDASVKVKEPFKKIVRSPWIAMTSYSSLTLWNGEKKYRSWYA
jgi:hypothetical protein